MTVAVRFPASNRVFQLKSEAINSFAFLSQRLPAQARIAAVWSELPGEPMLGIARVAPAQPMLPANRELQVLTEAQFLRMYIPA